MDDASEEALMWAYVGGDARAFRTLFARLAPNVHAFFLRSFRDRSVADELMQDTFLKLHRGRASYRPELPLRPWLFTIAAHVRHDELRRRYRVKETCDEEDLEKAEQRQAMEIAERQKDGAADAMTQVRDALDRLPESQRVVVQLHRFEGLTFAQIGDILGTPEGAVRQRAFRAYEQLRSELAPLARSRGKR